MTMVLRQKWERNESRSLSTVQARALGQNRGKQVRKDCYQYRLLILLFVTSCPVVDMLYMFGVVGGIAGKFGGMRMDGEGATHKKKAYGGRPTVSAYKPGGKVARPTGQYKAIKLLIFG